MCTYLLIINKNKKKNNRTEVASYRLCNADLRVHQISPRNRNDC